MNEKLNSIELRWIRIESKRTISPPQGCAWLCTTQTACRNYLPWHECVPERQTVLFVGDTSGKTSRCSPVVIIHGTAPRIRDRNEFSRVWINKKSSDRVTSRSRDEIGAEDRLFVSYLAFNDRIYRLHHRFDRLYQSTIAKSRYRFFLFYF